ncbi:MAG: hypothetical protein ACLVAH_10810 [Anaeromassilibacillus sp.]
MDAQRLSRLRRFLRRLSSISDCWIEWFTPFAGIRYSTNGHRAVFDCILPRQNRVDTYALTRWMCSVFCAFTFPTLVLFHQRLLDRMAYALHWCPAFNQWSPCSVSLHSDPVVSCRRLCSGPVDAQRLSRLRRFLRRLSSISDCWIEWFTPFAGIRYSTNGHRTVFHRILTRQCRVDAHALARWMHSAFCAFTFPTLMLFHQRLLDRMAYALYKLSGTQPMVTVQCFTAF